MGQASDGIRKFADELDAYVEKYGKLPQELRIDSRVTRADFSQLCRHFDLVTNPIPDHGRTDRFYIVSATRGIGEGAQIHGWNFLGDLCVKRTVMKPVTQWVCGDELEVDDAMPIPESLAA